MEKANRILTGGYFYAGIFSKKREKGGRSMQIYSAMIPVKESFSKKRICAAGPGVESGKSVRQDEGSELGWRELLFVLAG